MDIRILPPQPSEYMCKSAYWDKARYIEPPQTVPSESSDIMYRLIPGMVLRLRDQNAQPEQVPDGEPIPHLQAAEGVVRLVIDKFEWVETNKILGALSKPRAVKGTVRLTQFNVAAQQMETPDWYMGPAVTHTSSFVQEGHSNHKQISRIVLYAAADSKHEGWFSGIKSNGLSHTGVIQKIITATKGYQDFVFTDRVGDITAYNPNESVLYSLTKGAHKVIVLTKVTAAAVYRI